VQKFGEENFKYAMAAPGCLATLWHGRMLVSMPEHGGRGLTVLVSPSDDGSLVTMLLDRFGYRSIRGSSNKNPLTAVREMKGRLEGGETIVITPDGPRGPRHSVNSGTAWLARETGYPILPCGFVCDSAWHLSSWDHFTIPKRHARIALVYGEPIQVDPDAGADDIEELTREMKVRMMAAEEEGFERLGVERDW
jgi:lysophospholipid acyltransferase (LPLAT)-like uncharacterized protein